MRWTDAVLDASPVGLLLYPLMLIVPLLLVILLVRLVVGLIRRIQGTTRQPQQEERSFWMTEKEQEDSSDWRKEMDGTGPGPSASNPGGPPDYRDIR